MKIERSEYHSTTVKTENDDVSTLPHAVYHGNDDSDSFAYLNKRESIKMEIKMISKKDRMKNYEDHAYGHIQSQLLLEKENILKENARILKEMLQLKNEQIKIITEQYKNTTDFNNNDNGSRIETESIMSKADLDSHLDQSDTELALSCSPSNPAYSNYFRAKLGVTATHIHNRQRHNSLP